MNFTVTYGLLGLSILFLWLFPDRNRDSRLWIILLICSFVSGLLSGVLNYQALPFIFLIGYSSYAINDKTKAISLRILFGSLTFFLSLGLFLHLIPGFNSLEILNKAIVSTDAVPYSLSLNYDQVLIGIFIIAFGHDLISTREQLLNMIKIYFPVMVATCLLLLAAAYLSGYVRFEFKLNSLFFTWAFSNLFITCLSEEAFFRGFLQKYFQQALGNFRHGKFTGLLLASLLFGLAHFAGGISYVLLAALAGVGYGLAYQKSGRIEASILVHFTLNTIHFVFFTYPALAI